MLPEYIGFLYTQHSYSWPSVARSGSKGLFSSLHHYFYRPPQFILQFLNLRAAAPKCSGLPCKMLQHLLLTKGSRYSARKRFPLERTTAFTKWKGSQMSVKVAYERIFAMYSTRKICKRLNLWFTQDHQILWLQDSLLKRSSPVIHLEQL